MVGHGYAICLQCGFAVPEVTKRGDTTELPPRFEGHRRWARRTLPLWAYVSVTGVVIYWMLYRL